MTSRRSTPMTLVAAVFALALFAASFAANAQPAPNNNVIPTLDGVGLATLAGGLALAGSWVAARRHRRK